MPIKIPAASQQILDQEKALLSEVAELGSEAFQNMKHERLGTARANPSPEAIAAVAELSTIERDRHELREATSHAWRGPRESGYVTIRDELVRPLLAARIARREKLDSDVQDLRKKYPGLDLGYDTSWDSGAIHHLTELAGRNNPISAHMALADIVNGYSI